MKEISQLDSSQLTIKSGDKKFKEQAAQSSSDEDDNEMNITDSNEFFMNESFYSQKRKS